MKAGLVTTAGRVVLSTSPTLSPVAGCGVRMLHITPACSGRNATTKKHRTAFWERFEVLELAKPVLPAVEPPTTADLWRACPKEEEDRARINKYYQPNPLEKLYGDELRQYLEESPMVAVFQGNSMNHFNQRRNFQNARRFNFEYKTYSKNTTQDVLIGSKWENLAHFTSGSVGDCHFVFTRQMDKHGHTLPDEVRLEPRAKDLLGFNKKSLDLVFLCAMAHGRIMDKAHLTKLAGMPKIEQLHGELSAILQTPTRKTAQLLGANQQKLSIQLDQYVKDRSSENS